MSGYRIAQAACKDRRLRGEDRRVLEALEAYPDREGYRWPSQGRLAAELGMRRQHVNRAIRRLAEFGYLVKPHRSGRRTCAYYLTVPTSPATMVHDHEPRVVHKPLNEMTTLPYSPLSPARGDAKGGGRMAATSPPGPRPSDRGGGAAASGRADYGKAAAALARQMGRSKTRASRAPPDDALQRALDSGVLAPDTRVRLIARANQIGEGEALEEFGFTRRGSPTNRPKGQSP